MESLARTVLMVAYYFPPMGLSGVQRTAKFAKYLPTYGWKPVVLSTDPGAYYALDESLAAELPPEVEVYRTPPSDITRFLRRRQEKPKVFPARGVQQAFLKTSQLFLQPDNRIGWKKAALELGEQIIHEQKVDVLYATAPPFTGFLVAQELARKFDIPFVLDYRDAWVDNPFHFYATPLHKAYSIKLETTLLKEAHKVMVAAASTKERLLRRYSFLDNDDVLVLSHGYDAADFQACNDKPDGVHFTLTHSGLFQDNRTPKYFLLAVQQFLKEVPQAERHIRLRFVGLLRKKEIALIDKLGLSDLVTLTGYVEHPEAIRHLMQADVLWLMVQDTVRSPGKLYEYIGARKPLIVCAPPSTITQIAQRTKAAIITSPTDVNAIAEAIKSYYSLWLKRQLPVPAEEYVHSFDRASLTGELAKELNRALRV